MTRREQRLLLCFTYPHDSRKTQKWWLGPIVLLLLGGLIALSGTVAAPFVYTLF